MPEYPDDRQQAIGISRLVSFIGFTLMEYIWSGRIWVEFAVSAAFFAIFMRGGDTGIDAEKFFSLAGIFTLGLTIYTVSAVVSLGDRPQGYIILARRIGRTGYLLGLYIAALLVLIGIYGLISLLTALIVRFTDLTLVGWLLGTLPLMLNIGLLSALILLLSPMVLPTGWRLLVLGLIALAFSDNFFGNATLNSLTPMVRMVLESIQTILGWMLVPAFSGFALTLSRDYSGSEPVILIAQSSLLIALLGLSIYAFSRREIMLNVE